ncbi:hypothetical protein ACLOJK_014664 [Asimina triloba]
MAKKHPSASSNARACRSASNRCPVAAKIRPIQDPTGSIHHRPDLRVVVPKSDWPDRTHSEQPTIGHPIDVQTQINGPLTNDQICSNQMQDADADGAFLGGIRDLHQVHDGGDVFFIMDAPQLGVVIGVLDCSACVGHVRPGFLFLTIHDPSSGQQTEIITTIQLSMTRKSSRKDCAR